MSISAYAHGNIHNHDERRRRKLLLHRKELDQIARKLKAQGLSLIPVKLYLKKSLAKVEVALARGKKKYDKRQEAARRSAERKIRQGRYD